MISKLFCIRLRFVMFCFLAVLWPPALSPAGTAVDEAFQELQAGRFQSAESGFFSVLSQTVDTSKDARISLICLALIEFSYGKEKAAKTYLERLFRANPELAYTDLPSLYEGFSGDWINPSFKSLYNKIKPKDATPPEKKKYLVWVKNLQESIRQYRLLKSAEKQGESVREKILPVIEQAIDSLDKILRFYRKSAGLNSEMDDKRIKAEDLREAFEKEWKIYRR